jgi:hypothetical protein
LKLRKVHTEQNTRDFHVLVCDAVLATEVVQEHQDFVLDHAVTAQTMMATTKISRMATSEAVHGSSSDRG